MLVVQHTDRLARGDAITATHLIEIVLWAMKSKVRLRSVQDDSTCENLVLAVIKGDQAHGESERKSKAVKSGKQRELEKGNWSGGTPWDGYASTGGKSARLYIDETRAPVIRRIFELALEGLTRPAIMRKINAEGHRTRPVQRGTGKHHPHDGLPWTNTRVNQVLANPAYAGRHVLYRGTDHETEPRPGNWEAIIDPADFDRVQEKFRVRKEAEPRPEQGRPTSQYALSHLAVCGKCGRPMYGETETKSRKDGTRKRSYVCASKRGADGICDAPRLNADRIDQAVREHLDRLFVDMEAWKVDLARAAGQQRAALEDEVKRAAKELAKAQRQRDGVRKLYIEKQTPAREDALESVLQEVKVEQERFDAAERDLAALPDEPPIDAMLDIGNALQKRIEDDGSAVNERLRRIFKEFRVGLVDSVTVPDTIAIQPVLLPDLVGDSDHEDEDGGSMVIAGDPDGPVPFPPVPSDPAASPVTLLVPPPVTVLEVSKSSTAHTRSSARRASTRT